MKMELEKIKEQTQLSVVTQKPRLMSFLAGQTIELFDGIEGKDALIKYYEGDQFQNKPAEYWDKDDHPEHFRAFYFKCANMYGVRSLPDDITVNEVIEALHTDFKHLNEDSVLDALKMNLSRKLATYTNPFQQLDSPFFYSVLSEYNAWLIDQNRIAVEKRNRLIEQQNEARELSKEQIDKYIHDSTIHAIDNYNPEILDGFDKLCSPMYDYLVKIGKITLDNLPKATGDQCMIDAKILFKNMNSKSILGSNEVVVVEDVISLAKKIALRYLVQEKKIENLK